MPQTALHLSAYRLTDGFKPLSDIDEEISKINSTLKRGKQAFLIGAGASIEYPSLLPLVVSSSLPGLLEVILDEIVRKAQAPEAERLRPTLEGLLLEHVLDHLHRVLGDSAFRFLAPLGTREFAVSPNFRHRALAALAEAGACHRLITVNFDTLLEDACSTALYCPEKESNEIAAYASIEPGDPRALLLKLHGSIERPENLLTTVELVAGGLLPHKLAGLEAALEGCSICFLGYRNSDLDVFPAIRSITNPDHVAWYEFTTDGRPPDLPPHVCAYLQAHSHTVYSGDLDLLLSRILQGHGIEIGTHLEQLGAASLEELHRLDKAARDRRSKEIIKLVASTADRELTRSAACLVLSSLAGNRKDLAAKLVQRVTETELEPIGRSAYWTALAESAWKSGRTLEEIRFRKHAVSAIRSSRRSPATRRWQLEYRLKLAGALWKAGRKDRKIRRFFASLIQRWLVVFSLYSTQIDSSARGATKSMLTARKGRVLYKTGLRSLVKAVGAARRGGALMELWHRFCARLFFRLSVHYYRKGRKIPYQSQGWLRMHLQGVGQALTHLTGKVTNEAIMAIQEDAKLGANPEHPQGPPIPRGLPALVLSLYEDNIDATAKHLGYTWWQYRRAGYLGGVRETFQTMKLARHAYGDEVISTARRYIIENSGRWEEGHLPQTDSLD